MKEINGWLLLPTLGFIVNATFNLFMLLVYFLNFLDKYKFLFLHNMFLISIPLFFCIITLRLEFNYKKSFIIIAIITLWILFVENLIFSISIKNEILILISLGFTILWTIYFLKSKRVKKTFTK